MWSLRKTLVVIFLLVVAAPLLLFWAWPHSRAVGNQIEQVADKHLLLARNVSAALERYSNDLNATFDYLASAMLAEENLTSPARLLGSLRIRHLCLVDMATGKIEKSYSTQSPAPQGSFALQRLSQLARAARGQPGGLTGVMQAEDGSPALYQIRIKDGRMVLARIDTSYFQEVAKSISFGVGGHAAIVDQAGRVLAHPLPAWEHQRKDISRLTVVDHMMQGKSGVTTFYSPAAKTDMVAGFTAVRGPGWGVMVPQPLAELTDIAGAIQTTSISIFAMGLLAAALVALRISLLVIEPLQNVIDGAKRMARGETDVEIAVPGKCVPAELHALAETFNVMAGGISDARASEAAARERAEQANQQKTDFVRYVTHELRSPVNAILGFARMEQARRKSAPDRQGKVEDPGHVHHIEEAGTHLLSLINDLLDLGKVEAGHYTLREEVLGLDEIVERCYRMVQHVARERNVTLNAAYERGAPAIRVDERAIYQVILNLVTNAVRYGRTGGLVDLRSYRLPDGGIEICVCDDGPGIAPDDLLRVMEPFGRIEREGSDGPQGTGLGLPIVKKLVELHGGSFRLESAVGIGTMAYILLPASRCPVRSGVKPGRRAAA